MKAERKRERNRDFLQARTERNKISGSKGLKFFLKIDLLILSIYYQLISNKYVLYNIIHLNHHYVVLLY